MPTDPSPTNPVGATEPDLSKNIPGLAHLKAPPALELVRGWRGLLSDQQITRLANEGMITPFESRKVSADILGKPIFSYGLDSYGYGCATTGVIRCPVDGKGAPLDPKRVTNSDYHEVRYRNSSESCLIRAGQFFLASTPEYFKMPDNVVGHVLTKSSYARIGLYCLTTTMNPGWEGNLTLEFVNMSNRDIFFYPFEGVCHLEFHACEPCVKPYGSEGKYSGQRGVQIIRM